MAGGRVEDIYDRLKAMAVGFRIRPGDRLNEGALARELGVSRTPLREALNRLVAEKLFDFQPGAGFFCRALDPATIFDLYELRAVLETAAVRLACARAGDAELKRLRDDLYASGLDVTGLTVVEACARDEAFHAGIAALSGNRELVMHLSRLNERIRYIRWVSMSSGKLKKSKDEHKRVMEALMRRNADLGVAVMQGHIEKRMDEVRDAVKQGIANIYLDTTPELLARVLREDAA